MRTKSSPDFLQAYEGSGNPLKMARKVPSFEAEAGKVSECSLIGELPASFLSEHPYLI
jgi:hypothetical protein